MKAGTRVCITWMPKGKEEFIGKQGVITNWKLPGNHVGVTIVGVKLDDDFREIALLKSQVIKCK